MTELDEKTFDTRLMSSAETKAEIASFYALTRQWRSATEFSEAAVKDDPRSALAHETLGFAKLQSGDDSGAVAELSQAFDLDSKLYRSLFAKTMLSRVARADSPADVAAFRAQLMKVLDLNPQSAPAFVELAKLDAATGDLTHALAEARTAEKLEPWRAGYHLLSGRILLRMGHGTEAGVNAVFVANRWNGADHDESMELWAEVPPAQRAADGPLDIDTPPVADVRSASGIVKSVTCTEKGMDIALDQSGQTATFHYERGTMGFADTLWMGSDHFTPCYHTVGLRAVVHYKTAAGKSDGGDVVTLGFRDDSLAKPKAAVQTARH